MKLQQDQIQSGNLLKKEPVVDPVTPIKSRANKDEQESFQKDMSSQPVIPMSSTAAFYA